MCLYFAGRLIEGGLHYSLSTDDPILTGAFLCKEYQFTVDHLGATWTDIHQAVSTLFIKENVIFFVCF
jgi:adenosine deaminase